MHHTIICGVDEAGRGPLAGPVYAAAVVLNPELSIDGLADSKVLSATRRTQLAALIRDQAAAWSVAQASVQEIDELNILQASLLAMKRAVDQLKIRPTLALVDGNRAPKLNCEVRTIIKGDALEPAISAASILAKTERDQFLLTLDELYPMYGFAKHKGYGTAQHIQAILKYGPCIAHRRSFAPVRQLTLFS
jgi:ribonuclease HII